MTAAFALDPARFTRLAAPGTGRRCLRLTSGDADCYPLYYFIPSLCREGRRLVYHRAGDGRVELRVLDLATGADRLLVQGDTPASGWLPWDVEAGRGVWDHRSVLDAARERVIVFDRDQVLAVGLADGARQPLFALPAGRMPIGQNCITADGEWLVYIHADAARYAALVEKPGDWNRYHEGRHTMRATRLCAFHLATGEQRVLVNINSPIHHVLPLPDGRVVFCHPTAENGMLLTDLQGGWYTHLRTQDDLGGCVCHYLATRRGLAYDVLGRPDRVLAGIYHPDRHTRYEWPLPATFGYTHTGHDPEGRLWFWENSSKAAHDLHLLVEHRGPDDDVWLRLCHDWPNFGSGQRSHMHQQLTPDRRWLLFVAGDPESRRNHIHLIDVADCCDTRGIPDPA